MNETMTLQDFLEAPLNLNQGWANRMTELLDGEGLAFPQDNLAAEPMYRRHDLDWAATRIKEEDGARSS